MNLSALFLTLLSGMFFLLGFLVVQFFKQKKELSILATGMAFVVMLGMVFFDLIPEILELVEVIEYSKWSKIGLILFFLFLGIGILKFFDLFLPAHHHNHKEGEHSHKEHNHHMFHIGFIMALSLVLHNILEGMSMYLIAKESLSAGILLAVGVGLHNLPLGIEIASNLKNGNENKRLTLLTLITLIFSTFIGAFLLFCFQISVSEFLLFVFITIACGMILYIALFELLREVMMYKKNKYIYYGMSIGIFFLILMTFIE